MAALLSTADARIGPAAANTARASFAAIQQHLAESCRREEALIEDLAALEEQEAQRRESALQGGSASSESPAGDALEPESLIADSRYAQTCNPSAREPLIH